MGGGGSSRGDGSAPGHVPSHWQAYTLEERALREWGVRLDPHLTSNPTLRLLTRDAAGHGEDDPKIVGGGRWPSKCLLRRLTSLSHFRLQAARLSGRREYTQARVGVDYYRIGCPQ